MQAKHTHFYALLNMGCYQGYFVKHSKAKIQVDENYPIVELGISSKRGSITIPYLYSIPVVEIWLNQKNFY